MFQIRNLAVSFSSIEPCPADIRPVGWLLFERSGPGGAIASGQEGDTALRGEALQGPYSGLLP